MLRLINAFRNSAAGLAYLVRHEAAFRLEVVLFVIALPVAAFLAESFSTFVWLMGAVIAIMIVEILNTAVEQVCNGLSREYMDEIKVAKDCGSAAVLITSGLAALIWLAVIIERIAAWPTV